MPNAPADRINEFQPLAEQELLFLFAATGRAALFALPQYVAGAGDWSTSINVKLTDHLTLAFDGKNLTGELARQYVVRKDMPAAIYNNGKQFYLGLKYSL